uniref:Auxin response factor n=1 Tax=Vitis vinifera TaxID=29760 RepID=A5BUC2_VITVI|nr:hypothetical protein VITISV_024151 [Vitis vinifera]
MKELDKCLDPQLWHACAGGMVHMPSLNSRVVYFPQGHAEHAYGNVDFGNPRIPPLVLCRVSAVKYLADPESDEVYAKIRLIPLRNTEGETEDDVLMGGNGIEAPEKPASFAKTLTQSDANNGGGFSVPRYCAETIFPRLDYSADPPVQTILAKDVHGETWRFRHIYRGTPRRHLLTTGWSNFVNKKNLVAGDSIVFLRAENGDLCVGIRRAKRAGCGPESPSGWNPASGNGTSPYRGYSGFLREDENRPILTHSNAGFRGKGRVRAESVAEAATLAANGQPFVIVYYPRASTPEFCVKASSVRAAMQIQWCPGMKFKMAFETDDSSRISWFMGNISSVHVNDPIRWPNSPWRLLQVLEYEIQKIVSSHLNTLCKLILQVTWDEPDLLQNVKRVNPWLVELVSHVPSIHLSPFSPPRKKLRLQQQSEFPLVGQIPMPSFSSNALRPSSPLCCISDNIPAGIQGARHAQFGLSSSDLHFNKLQLGLFPLGLQQQLDQTAPPSSILSGNTMSNHENNENISCLLTIGNSTQNSKKNNEIKAPYFFLFGQPILIEQQVSQSCSGDTAGISSSDGNPEKTPNFSDGSGSAFHQNGPQESSSDEGLLTWYKDHQKTNLGLETGHCKVFMESEDVGRTLDLSILGSYEELYRKLANMFGIERAEMLSNVLYRDEAGIVKHIGDAPFG